MNLQGKLHAKFEVQQVSDSFRKREFVVEYAENPQFPQFVKFELKQDKCSLIDSFNKGDMLDIQFNLNGREWTNPKGEKVYFNTLDAWRISRASGENAANSSREAEPFQMAAAESDDLPF